MKIGFYLENKNIQNVDLSQPRLGNPGCGGTEFNFVALAYELAKRQSTRCTPILLANSTQKLPKDIDVKQASHVYDAAHKAKEIGCDFFIYRPRLKSQMDVLDLIEKLNLPTIGWAHLTPTPPYLRKMAKKSFFKALVCLEREQYDLIQDSPVWNKLTHVPHGLDIDGFCHSLPQKKDFNSVVYLGALVPQKGFHLLAKVWPRIIERMPNAKLTVIGTGNLYGTNTQLGPWNIADKFYEKNYIIPYLSDSNGSPHPSVHFAGKLGHEKKEILHRALIGVPNPTGQTETFCMSAVEFQACSTAIVSGAYYSLMDTVNHGVTGLLGSTETDLVNNICDLLENPQKACQMGNAGENLIRKKYDYGKITNQWMELFFRLSDNKPPKHFPFKKNLFRHYKWIIVINKLFQTTIGRVIPWPSFNEIKVLILSFFKSCRKLLKNF